MSFIKFPTEDKLGFFTAINPQTITHVTTTVGEKGGHIHFHTTIQKEPFTHTFDAENEQAAINEADRIVSNLLGMKEVNPPYYGIESI